MADTFELTGDAVYGLEPYAPASGNRLALLQPTPAPTTIKLGCILPKAAVPALRLSAYLKADYRLPTLPIQYDAKAMASLKQMYLNDTYGCCVIASAAHQFGLWTGNATGTAGLATDAEILAAYRIWNPGNQDNGCVISWVLDYMRDHGLTFGGVLRKIDGYVAIDWTNWDEVLVAKYLFGSLKLGINLPNAWLNSAIWDTTSSGIVGGHDVPTVAVPDTNGVRIASWSREYLMTMAAFTSRRWLSECYAPLSPDWYGRARQAPNLLSADDLISDMKKLAAGTIPDIGPSVPPTPGPTPPPVTPPGKLPARVVVGGWRGGVDGKDQVTFRAEFPAGVDTLPTIAASASRAS